MHGSDTEHSACSEAGTSKQSERRRQSRRPLHGTAHVLAPGRAALGVNLLDIGVSGISVVAAVDAPTDAECTLRFVLPRGFESMQIETQAVVAHSVFSPSDNGFRVGMGFRRLTDDQLSAIKTYVGAAAQG